MDRMHAMEFFLSYLVLFSNTHLHKMDTQDFKSRLLLFYENESTHHLVLILLCTLMEFKEFGHPFNIKIYALLK